MTINQTLQHAWERHFIDDSAIEQLRNDLVARGWRETAIETIVISIRFASLYLVPHLLPDVVPAPRYQDAPTACFACGRRLTRPKLVDTRDDQYVYVGPECFKSVVASGDAGYQPPRGGPRLFLFRAETCKHVWQTLHWSDEPPTETCIYCRIAREDAEHEQGAP